MATKTVQPDDICGCGDGSCGTCFPVNIKIAESSIVLHGTGLTQEVARERYGQVFSLMGREPDEMWVRGVFEAVEGDGELAFGLSSSLRLVGFNFDDTITLTIDGQRSRYRTQTLESVTFTYRSQT